MHRQQLLVQCARDLCWRTLCVIGRSLVNTGHRINFIWFNPARKRRKIGVLIELGVSTAPVICLVTWKPMVALGPSCPVLFYVCFMRLPVLSSWILHYRQFTLYDRFANCVSAQNSSGKISNDFPDICCWRFCQLSCVRCIFAPSSLTIWLHPKFGVFLIQHLWGYDRFNCLRWSSRHTPGSFRRIMTVLPLVFLIHSSWYMNSTDI